MSRLTNSRDEFEQIGLASACDLLLLGYSAFSWLLALVSAPDAVLLVHQESVLHLKYRRFAHAFEWTDVSNATQVAIERVRRRIQ